MHVVHSERLQPVDYFLERFQVPFLIFMFGGWLDMHIMEGYIKGYRLYRRPLLSQVLAILRNL